MKYVLLVSLLFSTSALAQQAPCTRGPSTVKMAGVDMDETRCQLFLAQQNFGNLMSQLTAMQAHASMGESDLAVAKKAADAADEALKDADATQDELQDDLP